jgi:hypothetical protein
LHEFWRTPALNRDHVRNGESPHMGGFQRRVITIEEPGKQRSSGSRFAGLGDRFARAFSPPDRFPAEPQIEDDAPEYPVDDQRTQAWAPALPRFAITRQGYDCAAVDEHMAELEHELFDLDRELAELRAATPSKSEAAAEIERLGEQTSTILLAAHDAAQEITRQAQQQADRCIADASSNAVFITAEASRQLSELQSETDSVRREREKLLDDVRTVAAALTSLAGEGAEQ